MELRVTMGGTGRQAALAAGLQALIAERESPAGGGALTVVIDPDALERALAAEAPRVAAYVPSLTGAWEGSLAEAERVFVPHAAAVETVVMRGAARHRVEVIGPVAPRGFSPVDDRSETRRRLELADVDRPAVVVEARALAALDLSSALVQLSLVRTNAVWLFDVDHEPQLAERLRDLVPGYGLDAWMFANDDERDPLVWGGADLVLGRLEGLTPLLGAAVGASVVATPPRREDVRAAHRLESTGALEIVDAPATLAVTLDARLTPEKLAEGQEGSLALGAEGAAVRLVERLFALVEGTEAAPLGLPAGLERLSRREDRRAGSPPSSGTGGAPDLDSRVDEELEALRKRLGL